MRSSPSISTVSMNSRLSRNADRLVSQIQRTAQIDHVRIQRPHPACPERYLQVEDAARGAIDCPTCQRAKDANSTSALPTPRRRVAAEGAKGQRDDPRVNRRVHADGPVSPPNGELKPIRAPARRLSASLKAKTEIVSSSGCGTCAPARSSRRAPGTRPLPSSPANTETSARKFAVQTGSYPIQAPDAPVGWR